MAKIGTGVRSGLVVALTAGICAGCGAKVSKPLDDHLGSAEQAVSGDCNAAFSTFSPPGGQSNPSNGAVIQAAPAQCVGSQNAEYRFSATPPSGAGSTVLCDWAASTVCKWSGASMTESGQWTVKLDTRRAGTTGIDGSASQPYAVGAVCRSVTMASAGSGSPGDKISVSVAAICDVGASPKFGLFAVAPDGTKTQVGSWQASGTFSWDTTGLKPGRWKLLAAARRGDVTATGYMEASTQSTFLLGKVCDQPSISITGTGPTRTVNVGTSCNPGASALVKLSQRSPSGVVTMLRDFVPAAPYGWSTASLSGTWRIVAEVRAAESANQYIATTTKSQALAGACTSATMGSLPTWSNVGTNVALSATIGGCASPEVKFRVRPNIPNAPWRDATGWLSASSGSWPTAGFSAGRYEVDAIARLAGSIDIPFEAESSATTTGLDADADGDGHRVSTGDCNDQSTSVHPGASEVCNEADDNCNGTIDDGVTMTTYYPDLDNDGWGYGVGTVACKPSAGLVAKAGDCDDANASVNPGATEVCGNAIDENCDGLAPSCKPAAFYSLPSGFNATCVSGDGMTVGGSTPATSPLGGSVAALTNRAGVVTALSPFDTGTYVSDSAYALNNDGKVVLGMSTTSGVRRIFRWTGGSSVLASPDPSTNTFPAALTSDGSKIVGYASGVGSFVETTPPATFLSPTTMRAAAASADASIIFGGAYRWAGGTAVLQLGPGQSFVASNASGTVAAVSVQCTSCFPSTYSASRWRLSTGTLPLSSPVITGHGAPTAPGSPIWQVDTVSPTGISADGAAVIGNASVHDVAGWIPGTFYVAVIWDDSGNGRDLDSAAGSVVGTPPLGQYWVMQTATGISADGKTVVGSGGSSNTYLVDLP